MKQAKTCDGYIIDTYRTGGSFLPGAIFFCGRRKMEAIQWKKSFASQQEADRFVRGYCLERGLREAANEEELISNSRK